MKQVGLGFQCSEEGKKDGDGSRAMMCGDGDSMLLLNTEKWLTVKFFICRKYLGLSPAREMP